MVRINGTGSQATYRNQKPAVSNKARSIEVSKAYNSRFYTYDAYSAFKSMSSRDFKSEKKADLKSFEEYGMDLFLKDRGLWTTVSNVHGFEVNVVREFYSNILKEVSDESSKMFGKVYVRGNMYDFSPASINKFTGLERVDTIIYDELKGSMINLELTGGKVMKWKRMFEASQLTWKYAVLHEIAVSNWTPTKEKTILTLDQARFLYRVGKFLPFDFGSLVFQNVVRAASITFASSILPFPNLIYAMLKDQGYKPYVSAIITEEKTRLVITKSLLSGDREKDLPYNFEEEDSLDAEIDDDKHAEESTEFKPTLDNISATAVRNEIQRVHSLITQVEAMAKELHAVHKTLKSFLPFTQQGE